MRFQELMSTLFITLKILFGLTGLFLHKTLDIDEMNKAANCLFDFVDFTSFSKLHTRLKPTIVP